MVFQGSLVGFARNRIDVLLGSKNEEAPMSAASTLFCLWDDGANEAASLSSTRTAAIHRIFMVKMVDGCVAFVCFLRTERKVMLDTADRFLEANLSTTDVRES